MKTALLAFLAIIAAASAAAPAAAAPPARGGALKVGEYACYGSGGHPLIGLGFKVVAPGRYADLDNKNAGTYAITGGNVVFRGGHLAGQVGHDLAGTKFRLGMMASCEPW